MKADVRVKEVMSEVLSGCGGTVRRCGCDISTFELVHLPQENYEALFTRSAESEAVWGNISNFCYIDVCLRDAETIGKGYFTALRDELFFVDSVTIRYYNYATDNRAYKTVTYRPKDDSLQITEWLQKSED